MSRKASRAVRIGLMLVVIVGAVGIAASPVIANIFALTIDEDATLAPGGLQMVVTGTLQCTTGETVSVTVTAAQDRGQQTAIAQGVIGAIACDGSTQNWGVTATAFSPFKNGPAGARATTNPFGMGMGGDSTTTTARLHVH